MLTKAQVKGNKSSFCSVQALHERFVERVVVRSEPPTAVGNDAQVAKVVSAENTPPTQRKEEPLGQHPDLQPLLGWMVLWSAAADADGRMQRAAPVEAQDGHFHLKGGIRVVFCDFFLMSSTFYTGGVCEDRRMNSPRSSETCWGTCWPPPRCQRAGRWWPGFHLLCGTGTLTEADRSSYTHWHTHTHIKSIYALHYI